MTKAAGQAKPKYARLVVRGAAGQWRGPRFRNKWLAAETEMRCGDGGRCGFWGSIRVSGGRDYGRGRTGLSVLR